MDSQGARTSDVHRKTAETDVRVLLRLDGNGEVTAETGLPFLDHMLAQLGRHGLFDLTVRARGDLEVDAHHTVEDVALALGQAFHEALGEHRGIRRMADAIVPLDEALAQVAVDLSGRGYAVCDLGLRGPATGAVTSDLWRHFLESLTQTGRFTLHVRVLTGQNDHHRLEAVFKALARALDVAVQRDPRRAAQVPSTKGSLTA
ncbi:MAG: imidazoleglycerol-phosphate dehydratase [Dehalococcoidia bacterium]|nr:imidazoleglycerol-phosphate dehydratase [Dehalococcoidia bacterium]